MEPGMVPAMAPLTPDLQEKPQPAASRLRFFTSQLATAIDATSIDDLCAVYHPFELLLETGNHSGLWWLDMTAPTEEDIETIARFFSLHPLTTEDIKVRETREKIELFGQYYFLSLRPPRRLETDEGVRIVSHNLYAVVFQGGVISFSFDPTLHADHVRQRIREHSSHLSLTSDWICYALIDDIVDGFAPFIDRVETGVEMVEDSVSITRPDEMGLALQRIFKLRKEVMHIRQPLHDKIDVIRSFARHCASDAPSSQVALYLSDICDHIVTMIANLEQAEQMLSRLQSKFLTQVHFDSGRMRNGIASALNKLTILASILVPMQFITGFFGMNVKVPGKGEHTLNWWFGILGTILGLTVLFAWAAKRAGLLDR
ncbi:magnesium transporter CorA family protein [Aspergillus ibericus CBS 121593]|uniref:Mg2+ transporter protein n=1 Tax=Aspergillus ibericus CBS 121593 TaxID=1448316 RepID=A0A395GYX4_9EURO|nr:Mg2+ transporter protein [Aspergillus ibericus CBS 121593]RAL00822.1 Mg2+ transporter protein [Aspergillus ibericus CBS 121593]